MNMNFDCTLDSFKVPGISGINLPFGTKNQNDVPIWDDEAVMNAAMPFMRQRPFFVNENSATSRIDARSLFVLGVAGITLTLGAGGFDGCEVKELNLSAGASAVAWGEENDKRAEIGPECDIKLEWHGTAWRLSKMAVGGQLFGGGRNLLRVFGASTVPEAMAVLHSKCNGEGIPDFWDLCIGDYLDIPSLTVDGVLYPGTRILISGFNHYKNLEQEGVWLNKKNHILFMFDKIVLRRRMNASNTDAGGYPASELRTFLEGAAGDGDGPFANGLRDAIGDYLYTVKKYASVKGAGAWGDYTVFPPTALEVGTTLHWDSGGVYPDDEDDTEGLQKKFPIFSVRRARLRQIGQAASYDSWYWLSSPYAAGASSFCHVGNGGATHHGSASAVGGCAPAFCVA
jgi:hypothetical protein